jgi:hypothetical protein
MIEKPGLRHFSLWGDPAACQRLVLRQTGSC